MIIYKASFDDGCALDVRVADLLERYGWKKEEAIFYIPSQWEEVNKQHGDEPLSFEQLKSLSKRFIIGSHTIVHPMLTRISSDAALYEIKLSRDRLERLLNIKVTDFCYPRGYANDDIRDMVRTYYKTARNTLVGNLELAEDPVWESTTVHVAGKRRKEYEGTSWLSEGRRLLKEATERDIDTDTIYHLWGHSWELERYDAWDDFEIFLKEIQGVKNETIHG